VSRSGGASLAAKGIPWVGGSLLLLLSAVVLYFFTGAAASEPSRAAQPGTDDITYGPADARVTLIEYSDFECPFCAEYAPMLATLRERYGDQVKFVYRFFPLPDHRYATVSAQAAYAAHLQGKFWEMQDLLYEHQAEWTESDDPRAFFDSYAQSLGLDIAQFHADMDAPSTLDFITRQAAEGERAGVTHTPWFVIDDSVVLPRSVEDFEKLIQDAL
jgi:protein-disulfide isomerase